MRPYYFICIFLCGCVTAKAQSFLGNADSLYEVGNYAKAALSYEMLVFKAVSREEKARALLAKARCHKNLERFQQALDVMNRVPVLADKQLKLEVGYQKALLNYLLSHYQTSYNELLKIKLFSGDVAIAVKRLEVLDLMALGKWDVAKSLISSDSIHFGPQMAQEVFSRKMKYKKPEKAYKLSLFLPGVGQMYAGHFMKGLVSTGIQATLVGFSAYSIYNGYFWTGGMTGVALFYTFYLGGARYAKQLAIAHNQELSRVMSSQFLNQ